MSTMRLILLLLLIFFFMNHIYSIEDLVFRIQPQLVRINNLDERYITKDDHYIGQVLYQNDQIELACECQTELNNTQYIIYWTINNKILNEYNNSKNIKLFININTIQIPKTYVTCYCIFIQSNSTKIKRDYQYLLYIDLASEPSLKEINYSIQPSTMKQHFYHFIHHHFIVILAFLIIIIGITCPLIILNFTYSQ